MAKVAVRVLGCGDAFGSGGRFQTCFFVSAGRARFLIDCGATALVAMRRFGVDPGTIDTIFLSHLHGDHFAGLPFLLMEAQYVGQRQRPLTVVGPPTMRQRLLEAQEVLFPGSSQMTWYFPLHFVELEPGQTQNCGGVAVTAFPVRHPSGAPAFALRFACGRRLIGYSGDTEWTDQLIQVASGADLLITECYGFDRKPGHHLDFQTLSSRRQELRAKRLLLTHMSQDMLDRFDGIGWEAAEDGLLVEL
jgi:ribonuclease BN (tRNA processing enzyme)